MSIMEILIRSISGYIFIIPGIILYFGALRKSAKRQILLHITTAFIFCYYLIGILTMTGIGKLKAFEPTLVLVPFLYFAFASIEESSSQTGWELEHNNPFPNGPPILSYLLDNFSNNHALLYQ